MARLSKITRVSAGINYKNVFRFGIRHIHPLFQPSLTDIRDAAASKGFRVSVRFGADRGAGPGFFPFTSGRIHDTMQTARLLRWRTAAAVLFGAAGLVFLILLILVAVEQHQDKVLNEIAARENRERAQNGERL